MAADHHLEQAVAVGAVPLPHIAGIVGVALPPALTTLVVSGQ